MPVDELRSISSKVKRIAWLTLVVFLSACIGSARCIGLWVAFPSSRTTQCWWMYLLLSALGLVDVSLLGHSGVCLFEVHSWANQRRLIPVMIVFSGLAIMLEISVSITIGSSVSNHQKSAFYTLSAVTGGTALVSLLGLVISRYSGDVKSVSEFNALHSLEWSSMWTVLRRGVSLASVLEHDENESLFSEMTKDTMPA